MRVTVLMACDGRVVVVVVPREKWESKSGDRGSASFQLKVKDLRPRAISNLLNLALILLEVHTPEARRSVCLFHSSTSSELSNNKPTIWSRGKRKSNGQSR